MRLLLVTLLCLAITSTALADGGSGPICWANCTADSVTVVQIDLSTAGDFGGICCSTSFTDNGAGGTFGGDFMVGDVTSGCSTTGSTTYTCPHSHAAGAITINDLGCWGGSCDIIFQVPSTGGQSKTLLGVGQ